jgi:hypothetical protein
MSSISRASPGSPVCTSSVYSLGMFVAVRERTRAPPPPPRPTQHSSPQPSSIGESRRTTISPTPLGVHLDVSSTSGADLRDLASGEVDRFTSGREDELVGGRSECQSGKGEEDSRSEKHSWTS